MGVADDINNTSGITGVQKRGNKWAANIVVKSKFYWLGSYKNIDDAVKIRKDAEKHVKTGDFVEWFEQNHSSGVRKQLNNTSGVTGVSKKAKHWVAQIGTGGKNYRLGSYKNKDDAVKIRKDAEKHVKTGDFVEWFEQNHSSGVRKQLNNTSGVIGVQKIRNNWVANIVVNGKFYWLASYKNKEDAVKIRKEAEKHVKTGDFTEWFSSTIKRVNNTSGITGVQKIRNSWWAQIGVKGNNYWLGSYKNKDDAVKIRKEAEKHVKTGDFTEWFENFSGGRKRRQKR